MARAPWYVAAGRWLKGIGGGQRKEPWTGAPQIRRYGQRHWDTIGDGPQRQSIAHPKPPRRAPQMMGTASTPTGVSERIGVGQRIGTSIGTAAYTSTMRSGESLMPIGLGAIRGEPRGGSSSGSTSGS